MQRFERIVHPWQGVVLHQKPEAKSSQETELNIVLARLSDDLVCIHAKIVHSA